MRYLGSPARRAMIAGALILAIGLAACGSSGNSSTSKTTSSPSGAASATSSPAAPNSGSKSITIATNGFDDDNASTALATAVLQKAGYTVKLQSLGSVGLMYQATANGSADINLDAWLPNTHAQYWKTYGSKLVKLGKLYPQHVTTGLLVPKYCPGTSIADLNKYASTYGGKIIVTSPGAGETIEAQHAKTAYGLTMPLVPSSEAAEDAALKAATATHKCAVVALWAPEPSYVEYPLRWLSDPKGVFPEDYAYSVGKSNLATTHPGPAKFLAQFTISITDQDAIMKRETQGQTPTQAVQPWIQANAATVSRWVSLAKG
jgi:glycine betaine/proline transport system substrate-binding protein